MLQVDAGIAEDLVFGDPKAPRYVFWEKKLRPTPSGPDVLTFDLLSIWGKIRAGLGAAGIKKPLPGCPAIATVIPSNQLFLERTRSQGCDWPALL